MNAVVDLTEIAKRVEGLARGDREVDGLIACAIFKTVTTGDDLIYLSPICKSDECVPGTYWLVQRSGRSLQTAPVYTASLDAAMSLVPDASRPDGSIQISFPRVMRSSPDTWDAHIGYANSAEGANAIAATPALALTAAALRARARLQEAAHD